MPTGYQKGKTLGDKKKKVLSILSPPFVQSSTDSVVSQQPRHSEIRNPSAPLIGQRDSYSGLLSTALKDPVDDVVVLEVVGIVSLDVGGEAIKGALKGFLGARVHHARLCKAFS